jgi:hypothetical protein
VRAFLRPFKGSFAYDNGMGNRHRAETSEAVVTSTLHPPRRRYGWADGIGAAAVLECPEEATRGICRAISQVLLHMDGYRVRKFGERVAHIVEGCTDADTEPKPPWLERKKKYLQHLRDADSSIRLVSAADKLYNAREILSDLRTHRDSVWSRFKGGKEGTLWYYDEVAKILRTGGPSELVEELDRVVAELRSAAQERL